MGEIRFVGTAETRGYPYLVCKKKKAEDIHTHWENKGLITEHEKPYLLIYL